ncbi:MAG: endonuclease/exonuclease/phosphatase family protein, partial [Planctomycetota bacterium]
MFFFGREIGPFECDIDWNWYTESLKDSSLLSDRRERFIELFTAHPKRFLGLTWGPGNPSKKLNDVAKLVYILYIPTWFVIVVLSILPGIWLWRHRRWSSDQRRKVRRSLLLVCSIPILIPVVFLILAAVNTHFLGPREKPLYGQTSHPGVWPTSDSNGVILKVMTYNIWMGGAYKGAWRFEKPALVTDRIRRIGKLIREYNPDLVFLQEVVMESGPGSVNQTPILAETAGMHTWAYGEDVNQGLPFYRIIRGNAILSKWPLEVLTNQPMAVSRSFFQVGM